MVMSFWHQSNLTHPRMIHGLKRPSCAAEEVDMVWLLALCRTPSKKHIPVLNGRRGGEDPQGVWLEGSMLGPKRSIEII